MTPQDEQVVEQVEQVVQETAPYIEALIAFGIAAAAALLWRAVLIPLLHWIFKRTRHKWDNELVNAISTPGIGLFGLLGVYFACGHLPFAQSFYTSGSADKVLRAGLVVIMAWVLMRASTILDLILSTAEKNVSRSASKSLNGFLHNLYLVLVAVFAVGMVMTEFGFNVTGLLTGLGLGSLTFSLAAKDLAANFFSGIVIILERPFETGDWISTGDGIEGTVENVAFRTTKIRTLDNTLVIVPNSKLTDNAVTNWTRLQKRQLSFTLGLTYATPKETVVAVCRDVEAMLRAHEEIQDSPLTVRLNAFGASSLDIYVLCYADTTDIYEYRRIREDVNLKVMDIMEKNKADFAFPSRSIYIESMPATAQ